MSFTLWLRENEISCLNRPEQSNNIMGTSGGKEGQGYLCYSNRIMGFIITSTSAMLIVLQCSLRDNGLTSTGAIALARALEDDKSLEELK